VSSDTTSGSRTRPTGILGPSGEMRRRALWLAILLTILSGRIVMAETPIDPLRIADPGAGRAIWTVAVGFSASGREGFGIDESGSPYTYAMMAQDWALSFSAAVVLGAAARAGASASLRRTNTMERREYADLETSTQISERRASCRVWHQLRLDPASETDPRFAVSVGYPASAGFALSGAILKDPMVLTAEVGFRSVRAPSAAWLALDFGAGFVANGRTRATSFTGVEVPVGTVGMPVAHLGCEVRYSLDSAGRDVAVRATLVLRGERPLLLVEIELGG
jgi:hypothetical protein